ncbi:unnamed protein product [Bursaphelenchus okinawaensis]|uniref:Uncharacterized protein n=1 Tax=Bursaphelenchus okinawaensis TaxID=465554 RepID=A0A811KJ93_9BILA|nr:unnamed protein product [Bursaphelenchus okinawaensis]CAG9105739.1 unnamed protein product [Bursaphelenchus okinawaensis]
MDNPMDKLALLDQNMADSLVMYCQPSVVEVNKIKAFDCKNDNEEHAYKNIIASTAAEWCSLIASTFEHLENDVIDKDYLRQMFDLMKRMAKSKSKKMATQLTKRGPISGNKDTTPEEKKVTTPEQKVTIPEEKITTTEEKTTAPEKKVTVPEEDDIDRVLHFSQPTVIELRQIRMLDDINEENKDSYHKTVRKTADKLCGYYGSMKNSLEKEVVDKKALDETIESLRKTRSDLVRMFHARPIRDACTICIIDEIQLPVYCLLCQICIGCLNCMTEYLKAGGRKCFRCYREPLCMYSPKHKINVCVIEKNMSTILTAIMCYLYDSLNFVKKKRNINKEVFHIRLCKYKNEATAIGKMKDYSKFRDAYMHLAVSREPIERFISGFTDKCLIEKIYKKRKNTCNNCQGNVTCFIEKEYERMMRYSVGERVNSFDDQHFFPQNWRCQFSTHFANYNIIKYSKTHEGTVSFFNELFNYFRQHNVTNQQIQFIQNQVNSGRTKHSTSDKTISLALEKEVRSSRYLMQMLIRMYYYDFVLFGYEVPTVYL